MLERARRAPGFWVSSRKRPEPEAVALAVAFFRGELTHRQVAAGLGQPEAGGSVPGQRMAAVLRAAVRAGRVHLVVAP